MRGVFSRRGGEARDREGELSGGAGTTIVQTTFTPAKNIPFAVVPLLSAPL